MYNSVVGGLIVVLVLATVIVAFALGRGPQAVRQVHDEMAQVTWSSPSLVVRYARVVLLFLAAVTGCVILLDFGFSHLTSFIL